MNMGPYSHKFPRILHDFTTSRYRKYLLGSGILLFVGFRVNALLTLPPIGDEFYDLFILLPKDLSAFKYFFSNILSADQGRFPHLVSAPFLLLFKNEAVPVLRLLFLSFNLLFCFVSYKLVLLIANKKAAATYLLLLFSSCYLASFSIFSVTTGDSLYLLFHALAIFVFLKGTIEQSKSSTFHNYYALMIALALCIASKLFGVLLLAALSVSHFFYFKYFLKTGTVKIRGISPLIVSSVFFLLSLFAINISDLPLADRFAASLVFSVLYGVFMFIQLFKENGNRNNTSEVSFLKFWFWLAVGTFCLTLVFSPIYLNLGNLIKTYDFFPKWNTGILIRNSNWYDMPVIILIKYGAVSLAALLAAIAFHIVFFRTTFQKLISWPNILFFIIFLVHFLAITLVKHKMTWYPLAIFPFLYLPIAFLFSHYNEPSFHKVKSAILALVFVVFTDNTVRYFSWYPFGHLDGAQYGARHIGWNRAAFLSSADSGGQLKEFREYINSVPKNRTKKIITISFRALYYPPYNTYTYSTAAWALKKKNITNIRLIDPVNIDTLDTDYVLSSTIYNKELEDKLSRSGYQIVYSMEVKGINIWNLWEKARSNKK